MVAIASGGGGNALSQRRAELQGTSGWSGLVRNRRIFLIAVFASIGGLLYGYNQGVFSSVLAMKSFDNRMGDAVSDSNKKGWLVAILELGAWFGVLITGPVADRISRKYTIISGVYILLSFDSHRWCRMTSLPYMPHYLPRVTRLAIFPSSR